MNEIELMVMSLIVQLLSALHEFCMVLTPRRREQVRQALMLATLHPTCFCAGLRSEIKNLRSKPK